MGVYLELTGFKAIETVGGQFNLSSYNNHMGCGSDQHHGDRGPAADRPQHGPRGVRGDRRRQEIHVYEGVHQLPVLQ